MLHSVAECDEISALSEEQETLRETYIAILAKEDEILELKRRLEQIDERNAKVYTHTQKRKYANTHEHTRTNTHKHTCT